jgi:prepilin-type N-terminal cleavage/methylation domain-containing protein
MPGIRRGFSLLELLVAVAIIATLVGTMSGFLIDVLRTRDELERLGSRERAVGVLLDTLERDLQLVLATGPDGQRGVRGDASGVRLAVAATPVRLAAGSRPAAGVGTIQWLDVRFEPAGGTLRMRREAARSADEPATSPAEASDTLDGSFHRVRFRYHDGLGWRESFDGAAAGLPVAIEVAVWFDPWPGAEDASDAADDADMTPAFAEPGDVAADPPFLTADRSAEPPPDRRRIIAIPDARAGEAAAAFEPPSLPERGPVIAPVEDVP